MLTTAPVYLLIRMLFVKRKGLQVNWLREITMLFFVMFVAGLASQTIMPQLVWDANGIYVIKGNTHRTNLIPFLVFVQTYNEVFREGNVQYFIINFLGNIILFIPIGVLVPLLWKTSFRRTVFIGFGASLTIETCQLFLSRGTDVDDLILNTAGVLLGALIFKVLREHCTNFIQKFDC